MDFSNIEDWNVDRLRTMAAFHYLVYVGHPKSLEIAEKANFCLSKKCRHCDKEVPLEESGRIVGYWADVWFIAHRACEDVGKKQEAWDCQNIDSDCNDCKHFQRDKVRIRKPKEVYGEGYYPKTNDQITAYIYRGLLSAGWPGFCTKLDKVVIAYPGQASMLPCFEHRKERPE